MKNRLGPLETFGLRPVGKALRETWLTLRGDGSTPGGVTPLAMTIRPGGNNNNPILSPSPHGGLHAAVLLRGAVAAGHLGEGQPADDPVAGVEHAQVAVLRRLQRCSLRLVMPLHQA